MSSNEQLWHSLREIAVYNTKVDVNSFMAFAFTPENIIRFEIHAKPHQTVLGTKHGESLVFAYLLEQQRKRTELINGRDDSKAAD